MGLRLPLGLIFMIPASSAGTGRGQRFGGKFGISSDVEKYAAFMEEMTTLIISKYDGSLKAEHGTGRNIAPFLEKEWGPKATALMWRIKKLFDPRELLAPGVMLNKDPLGHVKNTHTLPEIA